MASGWRFRPGLVVTIAAVALCALTASLGNWQMRRAHEKEQLQQRLDRLEAQAPVALPGTIVDTDGYAQRRVRVRGEYDAQHAILLDNKVYRGRAGYQVMTPLRIEGSNLYVLVDRGWVAGGRTRSEIPAVPTPPALQQIEGVAVVPSERIVELEHEAPSGPVWQNLVLDRYRAWSGLAMQPVVIQQTNDAGDGLVRDWSRPDAGVDKHRSYALQWYSLSLLTVVLYVALNLKRIRC